MNKVLVVARTEYLIAITSKAFLLGVVMMPVFMGGAILVQYLTRDQVDLTPRRTAIVDQTGRLFKAIAASAEVHNTTGIYTSESDDQKQTLAKFETIEQKPNTANGERLDVQLTEQVKYGELFAFAIIGPDVFDAGAGDVVRYHSQTPSYRTLATWLQSVINEEIMRVRIAELGLSPESVAASNSYSPVR